MTKDLMLETNRYLANIGVMYVKLHNLHWNVVGPQFKAIHEYLETIYDFMGEALDAVAEFIRMENEFPLATLTDYLDVATIVEIESMEYSGEDALKMLLEDIYILRTQANYLRNYTDKVDKFVLGNMLEEHITYYEKVIWFVNSMLK